MKKLLLTLLVCGAIVSCGHEQPTNSAMEANNALTAEEIEAGLFTTDVMWKMGRIGGSAISPDGKQVVYALTFYDLETNKSSTSLRLVRREGGEAKLLTDNQGNDSDPSWSADSKLIYFISDRSGTAQVWSIDPQTEKLTQVSEVRGGIDGYGISPKKDRAFYITKVQVEKRTSVDIYPDMPRSKALIYDDLMARHWNYWDKGYYSHIFVSEMEDGKFKAGKDIMPDEPWDAPMAPYFDTHEITWNNAGTKLAYTCKKMTGKEYSVSTDSDIYIYDIGTGQTENITRGMVGYDKYPVFSPDDSKVAFQSMARPGNEADKERLFVHDLVSGEKTYLTGDFDYNAFNLVWDGNESILFIAPITATHQIFRTDLTGSKIEQITHGDHDVTSFTSGGGSLIANLTTISRASELYCVDPTDGSMEQLTSVNGEIYDNIKFGEVQKRWVRTTDGKDMLVWVILPPDFDPHKKYPTLLYCQGGPQSVVSQRWSYRWNYQLMAAQGYIIVAPNRRGLPSFGQEWLDQISGDYSGQNIRDYLSAIDDVAKEPWADETRLGCVGASYGGYSAFFLAGNDNNRFKAFIAHCGIFNFESMYGETEELFFVNNDYGGSYWSDNPTAKRSFANSPHRFVKNWHAPILIITGLNDFRIPYTQSLQAFTAARLMDVPSRLVAFEDEAHQVFKPQNNIVWNREFFGWLDKYVKNTTN